MTMEEILDRMEENDTLDMDSIIFAMLLAAMADKSFKSKDIKNPHRPIKEEDDLK